MSLRQVVKKKKKEVSLLLFLLLFSLPFSPLSELSLLGTYVSALCIYVLRVRRGNCWSKAVVWLAVPCPTWPSGIMTWHLLWSGCPYWAFGYCELASAADIWDMVLIWCLVTRSHAFGVFLILISGLFRSSRFLSSTIYLCSIALLFPSPTLECVFPSVRPPVSAAQTPPPATDGHQSPRALRYLQSFSKGPAFFFTLFLEFLLNLFGFSR